MHEKPKAERDACFSSSQALNLICPPPRASKRLLGRYMNVDGRSTAIRAVPQVLSFAFRRRPDRSECRTTVGNSAEQGVLHLSVRISCFIPDFRRPTKREVWVGTAYPAAYARVCDKP